MATGAPGTNGVWQYGEDDSEATFSALLNKAAATTNTQIGLDRARLTALEGVGRIVQVVNAVYSTEVTTSSASYVTTGLSATITPKSATNKILILASGTLFQNDERAFPIATVFRGTVAGTDLAPNAYGLAVSRNNVASATLNTSPYGINKLDSPATGSAVTYTVGIKASSTTSSVKAQYSGSTASITLIEVVA